MNFLITTEHRKIYIIVGIIVALFPALLNSPNFPYNTMLIFVKMLVTLISVPNLPLIEGLRFSSKTVAMSQTLLPEPSPQDKKHVIITFLTAGLFQTDGMIRVSLSEQHHLHEVVHTWSEYADPSISTVDVLHFVFFWVVC